jgi:hypothetical protein
MHLTLLTGGMTAGDSYQYLMVLQMACTNRILNEARRIEGLGELSAGLLIRLGYMCRPRARVSICMGELKGGCFSPGHYCQNNPR